MIARTVVAAVVATGLATGTAQAQGRTCADLRGADQLRGKAAFKLVQRTSRTRTGRTVRRLFVCGKPDGRVRQIRAVRAGDRLEVLDLQGAQLLVRDVRAGRVTVHDVSDGRSRVLRAGGSILDAVVFETGDAAAVVRRRNGPARVVGIDARSGRTPVLDAGPVAPRSLVRRRGLSTVSWARGGKRRTADLAALPVPCSALPRSRPVPGVPAAVLSTDTYTSEYLVGELTGETKRTRACLNPDGVARLVGFESYATNGVQGGSIAAVVAAAGTYLLVQETFTTSDADTVLSDVRRIGLRTGVLLSLFPVEGRDDLDEQLAAPVLAPGGQVASIFRVGTDEQVVGFTLAGTPKVLDRGPAAEIDDGSLRIEGSVASWTRAGQRKTVDLATL